MVVQRESAIGEAEAELKRAEIDLYNTRILAPYDGMVSETHTEVGAYVGIGTRVVSMISDREIEIEAEVPPDRVAGLVPGATVRFRLDDGTSHIAEVRSVIPQENVRTRTRPVRFLPRFLLSRQTKHTNKQSTHLSRAMAAASSGARVLPWQVRHAGSVGMARM